MDRARYDQGILRGHDMSTTMDRHFNTCIRSVLTQWLLLTAQTEEEAQHESKRGRMGPFEPSDYNKILTLHSPAMVMLPFLGLGLSQTSNLLPRAAMVLRSLCNQEDN